MRAHNPRGISIGSAVFAQMTAKCSCTLQWFARFPFKIAPLMGGSGPHAIMVPWAHRSPEPKRQLDRFGRFAGLSRCCLKILWNMADGNSVKPCVIYLTKKIKISPASPTLATAWIAPKIWHSKRLKPCILSQAKFARIYTNYRDLQIRHTGRLTLWSRSGDDGLMSMSLFEPCTVSSCDMPLSVADGAIAYTTSQKIMQWLTAWHFARLKQSPINVTTQSIICSCLVCNVCLSVLCSSLHYHNKSLKLCTLSGAK